jgi:hypothetical protein
MKAKPANGVLQLEPELADNPTMHAVRTSLARDRLGEWRQEDFVITYAAAAPATTIHG